MENINISILQRLKEAEVYAEKIVLDRLKQAAPVYSEFYDLWRKNNRAESLDMMITDLKSNYTQFWLNEKYNKDIKKGFNMLLLEHSGLYGGELEAYAIDFEYSESGCPIFELIDKRFTYLDNISCFPAFIMPILDNLTENIQGREDDFNGWDDIMNIYELYEATALVEVHKVLGLVVEESLFKELDLHTPFYFAVEEHDSGEVPKLVYMINE